MHEDAPDELVHDLFYGSMWQGHPLGRPVLGYNETISRVSRNDVAEYWLERYSAPNLVVAAAGRVDHDELVDQVDRLYSGTGDRNLRLGSNVPHSLHGVNVFKRPTEQAHIIVGTEGLARGHADRHALAVLDNILGSGMSSRLFQEIREKRGLAYSVYSYRSMFMETGTFSVYAGTLPQNAETVIDLVLEEIQSVVRDGITEAELARSKGNVKGSLVLSSEDPGSRMNRLGRQQVTTGEILTIDELIDRFDRLTMEDIRRVIDDVFRHARFQVTVVGPFDENAFDRYAA